MGKKDGIPGQRGCKDHAGELARGYSPCAHEWEGGRGGTQADAVGI